MVPQRFFEDGEHVTETHEWDDEYKEEEQEWVEEADACCGNDEERDEDLPQDDVDLEEQLGSLETAEACATTGMDKCLF